jgi:NAD(P)-dependent dehydrogenase (short-subunit alcohol dehydrogenase family)
MQMIEPRRASYGSVLADIERTCQLGLLELVPEDHRTAFLSSLAQQVPLGRVADPDEIARVAVFLASDESAFVNGVELFADGGAAQV